jgi:hypothetical protein
LRPSSELNPPIREAFRRIREDRAVRIDPDLPNTNGLTSPLALTEAARQGLAKKMSLPAAQLIGGSSGPEARHE